MANVYMSRNLRGQRTLTRCDTGVVIATISKMDEENTKPQHYRELAERLGHKLVYQIGTHLLQKDRS